MNPATALIPCLLGLLDLRHQWRPALIMALLLAITGMTYLTLQGYQAALAAEFPPLDPDVLVVQESHTVGEIAGSRLRADLGIELEERGAAPAIPEIHAVVGTSSQDAALLRGVDLLHYQQFNHFEVLAGQALHADSPSRQTFIGWRLADKRGVSPGETLRLRGRDYQVSGVFRTGTYTDNEAWVSLADARQILGWDQEVSIFLVPDNGILRPGEQVVPGVSVARRGEDFQADVRRYLPLLALISGVLQFTGLATAFALATLLVRQAWVQRQYLAILRSLGFPRRSLFLYLIGQALTISLGGALLGLGGSLLLTNLLQTAILGLSLRPVFTAAHLTGSLAWVLGIALLAALIPALWLSRVNLTELLRQE